jgi:hypothetical protein
MLCVPFGPGEGAMARGYNATLDVKCWKEHTCCYCAAPYRYLIQKKQVGYGASQADAASAAKTAAVRGLRRALPMYPCPACGHFQPDMIGALRLRRHVLLLLITGGFFLIVFVLGMWEVLPGALALWLLILCSFVGLIAATVIGAANPNRSLRTNKALAGRLVAQQRLQPVGGTEDRDDRPRPIVVETGAGYWLVLLLLAATVLLMPGAELVRNASSWPTNAGWHPTMFGPSDSPWTWIVQDEPIESLRGEWRATGTGKMLNVPAQINAKDNKLDVRVTSRDLSWTERVRGPSDPRGPIQLWARVHIPSNPHLARHKVKIEMKLDVVYPDVDDQKAHVIEKRKTVPHTVEIDLASYGAGFLYGFFWTIAAIGGGAMFLLGAGYHLLRDAALRRSGLPTRVSALSDEESEQRAETANVPQPAEQKKEQTEA